MINELQLTLPEHLRRFAKELQDETLAPEALLRSLIAFGHEHIRVPGCGPFVAAVQDVQSLKVLSVGANLVVHWNQGWAHAERVALALAQAELRQFVLPAKRYRLLSTAQMCVACYGEALSSGLSEVITSATAADVEELTSLREGVLHPQWQELLEARGIRCVTEVERAGGRALLHAYGKDGQNYFDAGSERD